MRFTTLEKNEDLAQLVQRLFGTRPKAVQRQAEQLLLAANPHLAETKGAKAGSVVVLPDLPEVQPAGETQGPQDLVVSLLTQMREHLGDAGEALAPALQRQEEEGNAVLAQLRSPEIKKLAKSTPEIEPRLSSLTQNAKARIDRAKTLRKLQDEGLAELRSDLDILLERLGGPAADSRPKVS